MNVRAHKSSVRRQRFIPVATLILATGILTACATGPISPPGSSEARSDLTLLQNDPNLAEHARAEIREAELAVRLAEEPLANDQADLGAHRVYMADRKVAIARAKATARYAEVQRERLSEERDRARLAARTHEADRARRDAKRAEDDAIRARQDADSARDATELARLEAQAAREAEARSAAERTRQADELRAQIEALEAEATERGIVLTLGDVLFATDSSSLETGANDNLDKLVAFLKQYSERDVQIEGHTDNVGDASYNQRLSLQRAESVRDYLTQHGIAPSRLQVAGLGLQRPVANNDSSVGRQRNRRVEVIIENPTPAQ